MRDFQSTRFSQVNLPTFLDPKGMPLDNKYFTPLQKWRFIF